MTHKEMLEISFKCDDLRKTVTIREYLCALLQALWREGESFSGKRPFGNSGWEYDLYAPLVKAGALTGTLHDDGELEECDMTAAGKLIPLLISEAMSGANAARDLAIAEAVRDAFLNARYSIPGPDCVDLGAVIAGVK